jgi:hypothetical protein
MVFDMVKIDVDVVGRWLLDKWLVGVHAFLKIKDVLDLDAHRGWSSFNVCNFFLFG